MLPMLSIAVSRRHSKIWKSSWLMMAAVMAQPTLLRERYGERIQLIAQANQGPGIARNTGIAAARGEFIHFLDADDLLHETKVAQGIEVFRRNPEVSVIYTHFQFVANDGKTLLETPAFERYSEDVFCEMLRQTGCRILTSSSMCRATALRAVGGFADDPEFRSAEDWDLFLRLAARYKFYAIDQPLVFRRMHDQHDLERALLMA